jgi:hypothetical protein
MHYVEIDEGERGERHFVGENDNRIGLYGVICIELTYFDDYLSYRDGGW